MSLFISSLASGSNGNCYYVGNGREAVLIDAGISCREIEKRMKRLGLAMEKVKGIFISHEHSDHIYGMALLAKKFAIPVYGTAATLKGGKVCCEGSFARTFKINDVIAIGTLNITSFAKFHDAAEPCSFIVASNDIRVGVFTDIGKPCTEVTANFAKCHAVFLETNYDDTMLERGNYPYHLKNRIRGDYGHLSNAQALALFSKHRSPALSHLFLSHLSKNNNCPQLVQDLFRAHAQGTKIILASRFEETAVYEITGERNCRPAFNHRNASVAQLQLFG